MTLRVRLGLAAGIAVALAVLAVAISAYAGTKSVLRGQLDNSLQNLSHQISMPAERFGGSGPGGGDGPPRSELGISGVQAAAEPPGAGERGARTGPPRPGLRGPSGIVTLVYRSGGTFVPTSQGRPHPGHSAR